MKKIINTLVFIIFSLVVSASAQHPDSLIQNLVLQTNLDTLIHYVEILSGEQSAIINGQASLITSRYAGHAHNDLAADYIHQTLQKTGLPTYDQNYSSNGRNVYAVQAGTTFPDQQFIVCAHYDDMPSFGAAPGADDNASGTAAVLEVARILSQISTPYTIIYALWDEEEMGLVGSAYYAQQAAQAGDNILGVVNLEMFGWDGNDDSTIDIHTRPVGNSLQLAGFIEDIQSIYQLGLFPVTYNPGTTASDHSSFWNQGYTAVVFSQAFYGNDMNPYYHTAGDRTTVFNLGYFYALSRLAVATVAHLVHYNMILDISFNHEIIPGELLLSQNYPNPFNPWTTIEFDLPDSRFTTLTIYNVLGESIATLVSGQLPAGRHTVLWNASGFPSGLYFYRLATDNSQETRKMILLE
ncbi:MAG: M20/M25/M40 family metallo-hydrolase [bacterium]|nr:MAG: M20/M25/M40 family metallo-hydrolase [bacterium]